MDQEVNVFFEESEHFDSEEDNNKAGDIIKFIIRDT